MGKSIAPLEREMARIGYAVRHLCQMDASATDRKRLDRISGLLAPIAGRTPCRSGLLRNAIEALWMGKLAAAVALRDRYTYVHCHDSLIALGLALFSLGRRRRFTWGMTHHAFGATVEAAHKWVCALPPLVRRSLRRLESGLMRSAHWVVLPTQAGLKRLSTDLGMETIPASWHVIPHPLPELNLTGREEARSRLGWEPAITYVVAVGQFIALKRFSLLIEACAQLRPDVQLVLLGEGDTNPLEQAASASELRRPVIFGVTDNIGLYLSAADIYASASATESFGMANLEALAAGLPAVCTAVDAVPEVMGEAALLVEGDANALATALKKIIERPDLAAEFRRRALARARTWPDAVATAKEYERVYATATSS